MSLASVALELTLAALLIAALVFGWRLERKLKALRESHTAFVDSVAQLDAAALRADAGLKALREALDEAHDGLHDRIQKGRALKTELEGLIAKAGRLPAAPAALSGKPAAQDRADPPAARTGAPRTSGEPEATQLATPSRLPRFRRQGAA